MAEGNNKNRWSEQEKNALLISILAASGPPNWKDVKLPAGRSKMACQHVYMAAVKEAQGVALGDNQNADAVKKRGSKKASSPNAKGTPKRKRGKDIEATQESEISDDADRHMKKFKEDDEGHEVKLELVVD